MGVKENSGVPEKQIGYIQLLKENVNFRRLWMGQVVSDLGDWFNTIALVTLVSLLTGSELALGIVLITKLLPFAFTAPIAGMIADRFDRKTIMIVSDLLRGVIVLGFLFVRSEELLWLLYTLVTLQVVISSFFIPAKSATIPNITSKHELISANALSSISWSIILTIGAGLGGIVTSIVGTDTVFILNFLTYCISALFIYRTVVPKRVVLKKQDADILDWFGIRDIKEGLLYLISRPQLLRYSIVKGLWGISGGGLLLIMVLLAERMTIPVSFQKLGLFDAASASAVIIGLFYAARGLGTGIGPIVARRYFPDDRSWTGVIGWSFISGGMMYIFVGYSHSIWMIALLMFLGHMGSGANWVLSATYLQRRTDDEYRGRVFATESILYTLAPAVSQFVTAFALENLWITLQQAIWILSGLTIVTGILWLLVVLPKERKENHHVVGSHPAT